MDAAKAASAIVVKLRLIFLLELLLCESFSF